MKASADRTPGPWQIVRFPKEPLYVGPCQIIGTERREPTARDRADAALIAAAPTLLEACKAALDCFELNRAEMDKATREAVSLLRAAIARAEGRDV